MSAACSADELELKEEEESLIKDVFTSKIFFDIWSIDAAVVEEECQKPAIIVRGAGGSSGGGGGGGGRAGGASVGELGLPIRNRAILMSVEPGLMLANIGDEREMPCSARAFPPFISANVPFRAPGARPSDTLAMRMSQESPQMLTSFSVRGGAGQASQPLHLPLQEEPQHALAPCLSSPAPGIHHHPDAPSPARRARSRSRSRSNSSAMSVSLSPAAQEDEARQLLVPPNLAEDLFARRQHMGGDMVESAGSGREGGGGTGAGEVVGDHGARVAGEWKGKADGRERRARRGRAGGKRGEEEGEESQDSKDEGGRTNGFGGNGNGSGIRV